MTPHSRPDYEPLDPYDAACLRADEAEERVRQLEEQLEAAQRVVDAAQFYFAEMRAGRPTLTIGIEQALDALNPANECDGSASCEAQTHLHGCFAERPLGQASSPASEHHDG